jgi:hypothetical protein
MVSYELPNATVYEWSVRDVCPKPLVSFILEIYIRGNISVYDLFITFSFDEFAYLPVNPNSCLLDCPFQLWITLEPKVCVNRTYHRRAQKTPFPQIDSTLADKSTKEQ